MNIKTRCAIDWQWVKKELIVKERLDSKKNNPDIAECIKICLKKAESLCSPRAISVEKKILNLNPDSIEIEGRVTLSTKFISSYIKGADKIRFFLVTIGPDLEDKASRLMNEGEQLQGYMLDRIGSFAVESLAQCVEEGLRKSYGRDKRSVSLRFSPGYCDWAIEEQFKLEKIIDFSKAGVRLTQSCMMVPKKSISGVVGIGAEGLFHANTKSQCSICDKKDCDYKR